jgi:hypothetical protein
MTTQITSVETSPATLVKASAGAAAVAALVFTLLVLPAETGIDPTGVGSALGLTVMAKAAEPEAGEATASSLAPAAGSIAQSQASIVKSTPMRSDEITVVLPPHRGTEVKAHMKKGDSLIFRWETKGGPVKLDMHGEPPNPAEDEFTSFWKENEIQVAQGSFTAPFDGTHGWYWRNNGETAVTVTVRTSGFYQDLFRPGAS